MYGNRDLPFDSEARFYPRGPPRTEASLRVELRFELSGGFLLQKKGRLSLPPSLDLLKQTHVILSLLQNHMVIATPSDCRQTWGAKGGLYLDTNPWRGQ